MRAFLRQAWRTLGAPFRSNDVDRGPQGVSTRSTPLNCLLRLFKGHADCDTHNVDERLRLLEEGAGISPARNDAHTQTPEWDTSCPLGGVSDSQQDREEELRSCLGSDPGKRTDALSLTLSKRLNNSEASEVSRDEETAAQDDEEAPGGVKFPDSDRVVAANDCIVFLLTKETVARLRHIKVVSQQIKDLQARFEKAEKEACIGETFVEFSECEISDPAVPEHIKMEVRQELEERKPGILIDIQRKIDLETKLGIKRADLDHLRAQSEDIFGRIIEDAGIAEEPEETSSDQISQPSRNSQRDEDTHSRTRSEAGSEAGTQEWEDPAKHIAQQEYNQAVDDLRTARRRFELREEAYQRDVARHADGARFSREQVDLFHLQAGRNLTRTLREAEEEFERTLERAKAFGFDTCSNASSECQSWYEEESDDGYRESEDPANTAVIDYDGIEAWIATVSVSEEEPSTWTSVVEWDARSAGISDSCSACAEDMKQRRRIDRWHKHQESMREARLGIEE